MNRYLYDLIIIGASEEGIHAFKYFNKKYPNLAILLVSSTVISSVIKDMPYVQDTVIFSEFFHGIIKLYTNTNHSYCTKNVIIATGTAPQYLTWNLPRRLFYNTRALGRVKKVHILTVVGKSRYWKEQIVDIANKFEKVYICTPEAENTIDTAKLDELHKYQNIQLLPLSSITNISQTEKGFAYYVELDTGSVIRTHYILALTERKPDKVCLDLRMVQVDKDGYYVIDGQHRTGIIPGIFAVGTCTNKPNRLNLADISLVNIV